LLIMVFALGWLFLWFDEPGFMVFLAAGLGILSPRPVGAEEGVRESSPSA